MQNEGTRRDEEEASPTILENDMVEFSVDSIRESFVCQLCQGFYRNPFTTTKCRHTFCRSCLALAVDAGCCSCPKCQTYLGKDISKFALPDHMLQDLIDKVLFAELAAQDAAREREFYRKRGIPLKLDDATDAALGSDSTVGHKRKRTPLATSRKVEFELLPDKTSSTDDSTSMPALKFPLLRTEMSVRIGQLKKYLLWKLDLASDMMDINHQTREIEMLCQGIALGDELTVAFVIRTVWMDSRAKLKLTYRYAVERAKQP